MSPRVRRASFSRKTRETEVHLELAFGKNRSRRDRLVGTSTIPFFDHLLDTACRHGGFTLKLRARGDVEVDAHHLLEDLGLGFGTALKKALGDRRGIRRAGNFLFPMDEALSYCALDLSGRPHAEIQIKFRPQTNAPMDWELLEDFFRAAASAGGFNLHLRLISGRSNHHIAESCFKAFGRALAEALSPARGILSTKGKLD